MWDMPLRRSGEISLARQIYASFRDRMLSGQMPQGEALPSTRALAKDLCVSRNTVSEAYDMLLSEGFAVSRQGAPTRVAQGLCLGQGDSARQSAAQPHREVSPVRWDFKTGQPDVSAFPWQGWMRALREAADGLDLGQLCYSGPQGYGPLREEIAHWLLRSRGLAADAQDVFITSGSTQAIHLLVSMLQRDGRAFALESPCHPAIATAVLDRGIPPLWLPVDVLGADPAPLCGQPVCGAYVTPSHQFPLGGIMPAGRRTALLRHALEEDFYILEDDYDSEFRYIGSPVSPIAAMDASRVVYIGTFSKTLFPALRIGFAVLPKPLQQQWRRARNYLDVQNPILEQAALAKFLRERTMDRHVQHMRKLYGQRREALLNAVADAFGDAARPWGDASGLHVALEFPGREFGEAFEQEARREGIRVASLAAYQPHPNCCRDKLLLGYGHLDPEQIRRGVEALRRLVAKESRSGV